MSYINQSNDINTIVHNANFVQNSEKYFIDLTNDGTGRDPTSGSAAEQAAAYMQANEIRYITNKDAGMVVLLTDNGNNDNALETTESGSSVPSLALEIADYILGLVGSTYNNTGSQRALSDPLALRNWFAIQEIRAQRIHWYRDGEKLIQLNQIARRRTPKYRSGLPSRCVSEDEQKMRVKV